MRTSFFQSSRFSFFAYFKPNEKSNDSNKELDSFFGPKRVLKCVNRFDSKIGDVYDFHVSEILNGDLKELEDWILAENIFGCVQNEIDL